MSVVTMHNERPAEALGFVGTSDLSGQFRGKGFPMADLSGRLSSGIGLAPSNIMISAFGPIYDTPFGTVGELALMPVEASRADLPFAVAGSQTSLFVGDILTPDLDPWSCCPRNFLRRGLEKLKAEAGLQILATFEQEFVYTGVEGRPGMPYRFDAFLEGSAFGAALIASLRGAGIIPDSFLAENGPSQFEVTVAPTTGVRAADEAVIGRELTRAVAASFGQRAIHAPLLTEDGATNGTHVHISLLDERGAPVLHAADRPMELSGVGEAFVAGIIEFLPAFSALTAPSVASYYRLRPGKWAPVTADVGYRDRSSAVRICASFSRDLAKKQQQYNVEFRVADATASPYLVLGALIHAGGEGVRRKLKLEAGRQAQPLPQSLEAALCELERSASVSAWLGEELAQAYLMLKRSEIGSLDGLSPDEVCARYAGAY
jgi:glutamine synthetase